MIWTIDKQFDFCYGHRVWTQELNPEFSEDSCLACRHLHGHQGKIKVHLRTDKLKNGMVTDFKHLNWFKSFIDKNFDHKMIFDINDPLLLVDELSFLTKHVNNFKLDAVLIKNEYNFYTFDLDLISTLLHSLQNNNTITEEQKRAIFEKYEGLVLVDFIPTSENLCAYFLDVVQQKMKDFANNEGFEIYAIEFWETPKSHCIVKK